ncbi:hypothetical protein ACQEVM_00760 [Streptomyces sp. CA-243310]|uniref:hypothetical protein n=1 Tax=Streptomyces sp. CA-243310 TaxID=3240056 RepID=UPI003D8DF2F9
MTVPPEPQPPIPSEPPLVPTYSQPTYAQPAGAPTAYAQPAPHGAKSVTITFPVIRGKLAASLYLMTLLLLGVIAWAQVDQALTARQGHEMFRHSTCSGTTYDADEYTPAESEAFEEICGHPPRVDKS